MSTRPTRKRAINTVTSEHMSMCEDHGGECGTQVVCWYCPDLIDGEQDEFGNDYLYWWSNTPDNQESLHEACVAVCESFCHEGWSFDSSIGFCVPPAGYYDDMGNINWGDNFNYDEFLAGQWDWHSECYDCSQWLTMTDCHISIGTLGSNPNGCSFGGQTGGECYCNTTLHSTATGQPCCNPIIIPASRGRKGGKINNNNRRNEMAVQRTRPIGRRMGNTRSTSTPFTCDCYPACSTSTCIAVPQSYPNPGGYPLGCYLNGPDWTPNWELYFGPFCSDGSGDVNFDGQTNVIDIVMIIAYLYEELDFTDHQWNAANVVNDAYVNVVDVIALINMIVNPETRSTMMSQLKRIRGYEKFIKNGGNTPYRYPNRRRIRKGTQHSGRVNQTRQMKHGRGKTTSRGRITQVPGGDSVNLWFCAQADAHGYADEASCSALCQNPCFIRILT